MKFYINSPKLLHHRLSRAFFAESRIHFAAVIMLALMEPPVKTCTSSRLPFKASFVPKTPSPKRRGRRALGQYGTLCVQRLYPGPLPPLFRLKRRCYARGTLSYTDTRVRAHPARSLHRTTLEPARVLEATAKTKRIERKEKARVNAAALRGAKRGLLGGRVRTQSLRLHSGAARR